MSFINNIKKDNNIILHKIGNPAPEVLISSSKTTKVAFLDTETTGLNPHDDIIIELAIKIVEIENDSGKIVSIGQDYTSFNDPKVPIKKEISLLTGISDDMVAGKNIEWREVDLLIENSELIVAHNASFDRSFIDKNSTKSSNKIWACSVNDIDWLKRGFTSTKQELLCYWHGFYFDAHRAMDDVNALIHLLTNNYQDNFRPIVELVKNSGVPIYMIRATNFSYNEIKKNRVKNQGYKWNVNDKIWCKIVNYETLEQEKELLADIIYENSFDGEVIEIEPFNKYKN